MPTEISQADYDRTLRQAISRKETIRKLEAQLAEQTRQLAALTKERDTASQQAADLSTRIQQFEAQPSDLQKEVERLKGELKQRDHRTAFEKSARAFQGGKGEAIRPDALDALYKLAGGPPDGDLPDEAGLLEAIKAAVAAHPFVLHTPEVPGNGAVAPGSSAAIPAKPPGPGVSRGGAQQMNGPTPDAREAALAGLKATTGRNDPFRIA